MTNLKLLASTVVLAATLAGCGSGSGDSGMPGMGSAPASSSASATPAAGSAGTPAASAHSQADIDFASMMIPHHQQAIEMSDMLLAKQGIDAKVVALATQITAAQRPEITQMSGWLAGWGQNPSPSGMGGMAGMDHGDGLMSQADMEALDKATGKDATRQFLTGMVKHHQGAVTMAKTELASGQNPDAKQLAQNIITTQQAEITQMNQLMGK